MEKQANTVEKQNGDGHGMVSLAEKVKQYHLQSVPEATSPFPRPFPPSIRWGLAGGILVGALLGLLFGTLLFNSLLIISGWEGIFSLGPFTFHFMWILIGAALGLLIGGVGTILVVTPQPYEPNSTDPAVPKHASQENRDSSSY